MQSGRNPTRRNRNIGTAKAGHGQNNRMTIPSRFAGNAYDWRRPGVDRIVKRLVWGRQLPFVIEQTRDDSIHCCTVDDVARALRAIPRRHFNSVAGITGILGFVFRQRSRKEETLNPTWGRIGYSVDVDNRYGPVVFLDAQPVPLTLKWGKHLGPIDKRELARLQSAATSSELDSRHYTMRFDLEAIRRVQLYHTLPHELGHWADLYEHVEVPAVGQDLTSWARIRERYFQRPTSEGEEFADRYADAIQAEQRKSGAWPFERRICEETLARDRLRREDFIID